MSPRPPRVSLDDGRFVDVIDELRTFTPLGIRFWDWATDTPVTAGLRVRSRSLAGGQARSSTTTQAGIHVLASLPGAGHVERLAPGDPPPQEGSGPPQLVHVTDSARRFVPVAFVAPVPTIGVFPNAGTLAGVTDLIASFPGFYLFSSADRRSEPGLGVVRAQLTDRISGAPAAHAVARLDVDGDGWVGVADGDGRLAIVFPFPTFAAAAPENDDTGIDPHGQSFIASLRFRYEPDLAEDPWAGVPRFDQVLAQGPGLVWPDLSGSAHQLSTTIRFGQDRILRTATLPDLLLDAA